MKADKSAPTNRRFSIAYSNQPDAKQPPAQKKADVTDKEMAEMAAIEANQQEGEDSWGNILTKMASSTINSAAAVMYDTAGFVLDPGDWHHHLPDFQGIYGLEQGLFAVKEASKFLDNWIGDGENEIGNFITERAKYVRDYNSYYNTVKTDNKWLDDIVYNGLPQVIGSIGGMMAGGAVLAAAKVGGIGQAMAMTGSVGGQLASEVYDETTDYYLDQNENYKSGLELAKRNAMEQVRASAKEGDDVASNVRDAMYNAEMQYKKQFLRENPALATKIRSKSIDGAEATLRTNLASFATNLAMGRMYAGAFGKFGKQPSQKFSRRTKVKRFGKKRTFLKEGGKEAWEEAVLESQAQAYGKAVGRGEYDGSFNDFGKYLQQDAWKNFATRQTAVEGILGFMGGGGNVSLTNAYTYKERKKELDDAIKEMDLQDEIVKSKGGIGMLDFVSSHSLFKNQLATLKKAIVLEENGQENEAKELKDRVLAVQAEKAFQTGTTENLLESYNSIATDENNNADVRKNALEAISQIKEFEKIYNKTQKSNKLNKSEIYENRANVHSLKKAIKNIDTLIAQKETELLSEIETGKKAKKGLPSLKFTQDYEAKGGDTVTSEETLDFELSDLDGKTKYKEERKEKQHQKFVNAVNKFETAKQLAKLKQERDNGIETLSGLQDDYNSMTSAKEQKELKAMEKLIAKVEADGIFAKKPLGFKKSKRKLLEKSEKEIDKFLKPYENKVSPKRLSAVKKYFIARQIQEVAKQNKKNQESAKNIAQKEKIDREDNKITSNNKPTTDETSVLDESDDGSADEFVLFGDDDSELGTEPDTEEAREEGVTDKEVTDESQGDEEGEDASDKTLKDTADLFHDSYDPKEETPEEKSITALNNYKNKLSKELGREASFKDLMEHSIQNRDAETLKKQYSKIADIWLAAGHTIDNKNKIFKELFDSVENAMGDFFDTLLEEKRQEANQEADTEEQSSQTTEAVLKEEVKEEQVDELQTDDLQPDETVGNRTSELDATLNVNQRKYAENDKGGMEYANHYDGTIMEGSDELSNPFDVLRKNKYYPGTKSANLKAFIPTVENSGKSYKDFRITMYSPSTGQVLKNTGIVTFSDWEKKVMPKLSPEEQKRQWMEKVPIVVMNENGETISLIHDTNWINKRNKKPNNEIGTIEETLAIAKEKNNEIRKAVVKAYENGSSVDLEVTGKTKGWYDGIVVYKLDEDTNERIPIFDDSGKEIIGYEHEFKPLRERGGFEYGEDSKGNKIEIAQSKPGIWIANKGLLIEGGEIISRDQIANEIVPVKDPKTGKIIWDLEARQTGSKVVDGKLVPMYTLFPVRHGSISEENVQSILSAIVIYGTQKSLNPTHKKMGQDAATRIYSSTGKDSTTGINIMDYKQLETFIEQYIRVFRPGKLDKSKNAKKLNQQIADAASRTLENGQSYISIINGVIYYGVAGESAANFYNFSKRKATKNKPAESDEDFKKRLKSDLNTLARGKNKFATLLRGRKQNISKAFLENGEKAIKIDKNLNSEAFSYSDQLIDTLESNLQGFNVGTNEEPHMVHRIQPTISVRLKGKQTKTTPITAENLNNKKASKKEAKKIANAKGEVIVDRYAEMEIDEKQAEIDKARKENKEIETETEVEPTTTKDVETELFSKKDKKGRTFTYYSNTKEKDGLIKTNFTFNRSDKDASQRNSAGIPIEKAFGDKYSISEGDLEVIGEDKPVLVREIRIDEGGAGATVTFEDADGDRYTGEVVLNTNTTYEAELAALETQPVVEETQVNPVVEENNKKIKENQKEINKIKEKFITKEIPLTKKQVKENLELDNQIDDLYAQLNTETSKAPETDPGIRMQEAQIKKINEEIEKLENQKHYPTTEQVAQKLEFTPEEIEAVLEQTELMTGWLGDDVDNLDPRELSEEEVQEILKTSMNIPGLLPYHQQLIIQFVTDSVFAKLKIDDKTTITDLQDTISNELDILLEKQIKDYKAKREVLSTVEDTNERAKAQINKIDKILDYIDNISNNKETIVQQGVGEVLKYSGIKQSKELFDENNDREKNYTKTFLEESSKESSSFRIKRFLRGIQEIDADGNPMTGFLEMPITVPFETMFNSLENILSGTHPSLEEQISVLKKYAKQLPVLETVIAKLENADKQTQNEFVSLMAKKNTQMEFIMYSVTQGETNLQVYRTGSLHLGNATLNNWYNNFKTKKGGIVIQEQGSYFIDSEKGEELLNELSSFSKPLSTIRGKNKNTFLRFKQEQKENPNKKLPDNSPIKGLIKDGETQVLEVNDKTKLSVTRKGDKLHFSTYKPSAVVAMFEGEWNQKGNDIIKKWLSNFGIEISDNTIKQLVESGMRISRNDDVSFKEMFDSGRPSVFNLLKQFLEENSKGGKLVEIVNPLSDNLFKKLAHINSSYDMKNLPSSIRDNGKTVQQFTISKFITDRFDDLTSETDDTVREQLEQSAFSKISMWLSKLKGEEKGNFKITYLGLTAFQEMGRKLFGKVGITDLPNVTAELTRLGAFQSMLKTTIAGVTSPYTTMFGNTFKTRIAKIFSPTMSDKTTQTMITAPVIDFDINHFEETDKGDLQPKQEVIDLLLEQLILPELNRMISFYKNGGKTNIKGYDDGAGMFLMFPEFNNIIIKDTETGNEISLPTLIESNELTLEQVLNIPSVKSQMNTKMYQYVDALLKEKLQNWKDNQIVSTDENGDIVAQNYFDSKYFEKFDSGNPTIDKKVQLAALDFILNEAMGISNSFMLIAGDPAMYYKSKEVDDAIQISKDVFTNVGKRLANQIAPGNKLADSDTNQYYQIFLEDIATASGNLEFLSEALGDKKFTQEDKKQWQDILNLPETSDEEKIAKTEAKKIFIARFPKLSEHFEVEGTDAQEYTTWKEHLYVLEQLGKTPDAISNITIKQIEDARKIFEDGKTMEELNDKEKALVQLVMQPIKPVYTGQHFDENMELMRTVYIKSSSIPLIPQLTRGKEIDKLRLAMEKLENESIEKDENGKPVGKPTKTVRASYQSANKVGALSNPVELFDNATGKMLDLEVDVLYDKIKNSNLILNRSNFRIQQDIPFKTGKRKEDTVSQGTQPLKLLLGDGVTNMEGFDFNGNPNTTGKELQTAFTSSMLGLAALKRNQLYTELGIDINTNKPYSVKKSAYALQKLLRKEAQERGYGKQVIDSIQLRFIKDYTGKISDVEFELPLWMSTESNRFESLLNAIVTNRIAKVKMPGNAYVVASQEGFVDLENYKGDKSKIIHTSAYNKETGLQGATFNEDGSLKKTQVFMPSRFRDNDGNIIDLFKTDDNGNYIYVIENKEDNTFELNEEMFDPELLSNISFRVPTSSHQSMADVEIAGFLPYEVGDLMIVPRNLTVQVGLDFDIDKQTNYHLYHTLNEKTGKIEVLKGNIDQIKKDIDAARKKLNQKEYQEVEQEIEDAKKQIDDSIKKIDNEINRLEKEKANQESLIDTLWDSELTLDSKLKMLSSEIQDLKNSSSKVNGIDISGELLSEINKLEKEKTKTLKKLEKVRKERIKISKSKFRSEDVKAKEKERADVRREKLKNFRDKVSEKRPKVKAIKNETRLFIEASEKLYEKLLKNEMVKIYTSVLSSPQMQGKINKVLSTKDAETQADNINDIKNPPGSDKFFTPLSGEYQKQVMEAGASGQIGIGAYSNDVVFHSLVQQLDDNKKLNALIEISFDGIKSEGNLGGDKTLTVDSERKREYFKQELMLDPSELNNRLIKLLDSKLTKDHKKAYAIMEDLKEKNKFYQNLLKKFEVRSITEVLAERQNIATDNAKLLVMNKVNINSETLDVDKVLVLLGFDKDIDGRSIPFYFLSQPILVDYVKFMKYAKSPVAFELSETGEKTFIKNKDEYVRKKLAEKYGFDPFEPVLERQRAAINVSGKAMEEQLTNPTAEFQREILHRFIELKEVGEELRSVQKTLNMDSQGIGKSTFDTIDKIERLEDLENRQIANATELISSEAFVPVGNIPVGSEIDLYYKNEGYIRLNTRYIKPTTIAGVMATYTLGSASDLWSKYLPYDAKVMKAIFNEIMTIRGLDKEKQTPEVKQQILKEMKKYMNTVNAGLYTKNPDKERYDLFIDREGHESLATYFNGLMSLTEDSEYKSNVKTHIQKNPLLIRLRDELELNTNGEPSLIKFNNAIGENFDEEILSNALLELLKKKIKLPNKNGKPYNTRLLAQDLINYALLEGGLQEAIQFVKHIPFSYLKETGFADVLSKTVLIDAFGTKINRKKNDIAPSRFAVQYAQHFPNLMPKIEEGLMSDQVREKGQLKEFTVVFDESEIPPPFVSIYNRRSNKNHDLYLFTGDKYVKIPTLGKFGMNEYNAQTENIYRESIMKQDPDEGIEQPVFTNRGSSSETTAANIPHALAQGNIKLTLQSIAEADYEGLSMLAELLLPLATSDISLSLMKIEQGYGKYNMAKNAIAIDIDGAANRTNEETARTILHEYVHSITKKQLAKYLNFKRSPDGKLTNDLDNNNIYKLGEKNTPKHVKDLVRLFKYVNKEFSSEVKLINNKIAAKQALTSDERRIYYGAKDIFEFLTLMTTSPEFQKEMGKKKYKETKMTLVERFKQIMNNMFVELGIKADDDSVIKQGINALFEFVEKEHKTKLEKGLPPLNKSTDANQKFINKANEILDKKPHVPSLDYNYETPKYKINKKLESLAGNDGKNIFLKSEITTLEDFFKHLKGEFKTEASEQKRIVLSELIKHGYPLERIEEIINSEELAKDFLLLHEQDHIDNDDISVYWKFEDALVAKLGGTRQDYRDLLTPDKIAIEVRATINALKKIELGNKISPIQPVEIKGKAGVEISSKIRQKILDKYISKTADETSKKLKNSTIMYISALEDKVVVNEVYGKPLGEAEGLKYFYYYDKTLKSYVITEESSGASIGVQKFLFNVRKISSQKQVVELFEKYKNSKYSKQAVELIKNSRSDAFNVLQRMNKELADIKPTTEELTEQERKEESADVLKEYSNSEFAKIARNSNNEAEDYLGKLLSKEEKNIPGGKAEQEMYEYGIIQRIFADDGSKIQRVTDYDGKVYGIPLILLSMNAKEVGLFFDGKKDFSLSEKQITEFFNSKFKPAIGQDDSLDPKEESKYYDLEIEKGLRHPTGRRKTYIQKEHKKTMARTISLNKNNKNPNFKYTIIKVVETGPGKRVYESIAMVDREIKVQPNKYVPTSEVNEIDNLIAKFEKTCK